MTISATTNRVVITGNGVTVDIPFPYPVFAASDLVVIATVIATGVQTTKFLTTHYTFAGTQDDAGHYPNGGTVTALVAPPSTQTWTVYRDPPATQGLDLVENDDAPAEAQEAQFDYLTMLVQRAKEQISRTLKQPEGDSATIDYLPAKVDRASRYLGFDTDGDPVALDAPVASANVSAFITTLLDDANAATARATLGIGDEPLDSVFRIDGSVDATKKLAFEVDGLPTGTTRTITPLPNQNLALESLIAGINDFRLSLTTGVPVTTTDVTAAGTLYCVPYVGNRIALYDGTNWLLRTSAQFSLGLTLTADKPYDIFCYDNAGTPTLEVLVWTNDTTRATALVYQNGVLVKSGATTRRYLGSLYASGADVTENSYAKRYLWNYYHRVELPMRVTESTDSWTYTTAAFRQARATGANRLDFIMGVHEEAVSAEVRAMTSSDTANIGQLVAIGLDSTTTKDPACITNFHVNTANGVIEGGPSASWCGYPGVGRHILVWLEYSQATGVTTWYGDDGAAVRRSGIIGRLRG
jgi:hypothetical protein